MDWIAMVCILSAALLLRFKSVWGWVFNILGSGIMVFYFLTGSPIVWSLAILNIVFMGLSIEALHKWRKEQNANDRDRRN